MLAVASCGHPGGGGGGSGGNSGSGGSGNCTSGTLGCACNGSSCDDGLVCATDLNQCVTTASGSGGTTGSGGDTGSGGAVSSGGATGSGGAASGGATGSGGTVSSGGATGSGGASGGGATGSGGTTGSGGSSAGPNLLANGDFSQGETNWHFENGSANVNNGQYCETNTGSNALFGWQDMTTPLTLSGSQMYTLSYKASGSGGAVLHLKVAHAVSPYTPDDYETNPDDQLTASAQTFTHSFKPGQGDDSNTGVAFFVMSGQNICISNVSLVAN